MDRCQLSMQAKNELIRPKLRKVTSTPYWDRLVVELQIGQAQKHVEAQADELAMAFKSERIVITRLVPRRVEIALMRRDPLVKPVAAAGIPASVAAVNFRRVPVGTDEFGQPYTVSLLGGHTVVAGSTGAGKASLEWNILRSVAPAIAAGLVRPVFIDPKQKELLQGREIVAAGDYVGAGADNLPEETLALLERLVSEMERANTESGIAGERDFVPSVARPLTLIFIDELAPLLAYWKRSLRDKIGDLLGLLLTQGRGVGYILVGAIQEPTKDVFSIRDLFTRRLAMRLPTESHTDAALIEHAADYGARCHEILDSLPGMVYSLQDGARSTVRARLGHVRDEDIDELVEYIEASRKVVPLSGRFADADDVAA
jgi:S-DNA-T family DNA segregation ATPase FtsK/SpoIIIE